MSDSPQFVKSPHRIPRGHLIKLILLGTLLAGGCILDGDELKPTKIRVDVLSGRVGSGRVKASQPLIRVDCTMVDGEWVEPKGECRGTPFSDLGGVGEFDIVGTPGPGYQTQWECPWNVTCSISEDGNTIHIRYEFAPPGQSIQARVWFPEAVGSLRITTSTTGTQFDPSGYSITIDGEDQGPIGANESLDFTGLSAMDHTIGLVVDENRPCTVQGPATQTATIITDETTEVTFEVFCEFQPGSIQVSTSTVGGGTDPDGFDVLVDGVSAGTIGNEEILTLTGLVPGDRFVELSGISSNCTLTSPNGVMVPVSAGATSQAVFAFDCSPPVKGSILVSTTTTGSDLDPDGYQVFVDFEAGVIGVNEEKTFSDLEPGNYEVELGGIDGNCTLDTSVLQNPRTIPVTAGEVTSTEFVLSCDMWPTIRVTTETTGWDLDPDGYRVFLEETGRSSNIDINGEYVFDRLTPGNYTVNLDGDQIEENCSLQEANPSGPWLLDWDQTRLFPYTVRCSGIVFQSNRDGFWELYAMNSDGSGLLRILPSLHTDENPAWSPDGTRVAFASDRDGDQDIYVLTLADSSLLKITDNTADDDDPAWSPDGQSILYASDVQGGKDDLYVMSADGVGAPRRITTHVGDEDDANWSPVDPLGGTAQWIVFSSDRDVDGDDELYKLDISQDPLPAPIKLTANTVKDDDPVWSPDGTKIVFSRRTNGDNRDIFVMNADGTGVVQLTVHLGDDPDPSWSPDGTRIVFSSDRDGNNEIYVMNADGTEKTRLTFHGAEDAEPSWR